jgi:hypothetical protein
LSRLQTYHFNPFDLNDENINLPNFDSDPDLQYFNDMTYTDNLSKCDYYLADDFNKMTLEQNLTSSGILSLMHLNIRSLPKHEREMKAFLSGLNINFRVIGITETWLSDTNCDLYNINGYEHFKEIRDNRRGGGVSIFVDQELDACCRQDICISESYLESVFIEVSKENCGLSKDCIIGVLYRPPNTDVNHFTEKMNELLIALKTENKIVYIMGDFNLNVLGIENHLPTSDFMEMMYSFGLFPVISRPTRVTANSVTLIDNIFTNDISNTNNHQGIFFIDISDNFPVFFINGKSDTATSDKFIWKRSIDANNINAFQYELLQTHWNDVLDCNDGQVAFEKFHCKFSRLYNTFFPLKKIKLNYKNRKPWLTNCLKKSIRTKNHLYIQSLRTKKNEDINTYKTYKAALNRLLKRAERSHYESLLQSKANMKKLWIIIKDIINKKSANSPKKFKIGEEVITDKKVISNKFNDYFINIGHDLARNIPNNAADALSYMNMDYPNSIVIYNTDESEVNKVVKSLKNTSTGWDGIHNKVIKSSLSIILKPLTHVLNLSLSQGTFPDSMKIARVIPLYKSGNDNLITNYRPISILPVFSKLFERLMYNRLMDFIMSNDILYKYQFGFRRNYSTTMALVTLVDNIMSALDTGNIVIGVFLDFKKAFDTVNHDILLNKLSNYGIRGVAHSWIKSYLSNRYQYVSYNNTDSQKKLIKCGVPQGSILGPLLFLLYINDITFVSDSLLPIIFADDTNVFLKGKNLNDMIDNMNTELEKIVKWLNANKLSLNISKTQYMVFRTQRTKITHSKELSISGINLEFVEHAKFLGVYIDYCFTWDKHIQTIKSKISRGTAIIKKAKPVLNMNSLITMYYSFIYPYLSYCVEVWGKAATILLSTLQKLQKQVIRNIRSVHYRAHSAPIFKELGLLNLNQICRYKTIIFMFKFVKGMLPSIFHEMFTRNCTMRTRQRYNLKIPQCRTSAFQKTMRYQGVKEWNSICETLDHLCSVHSFKKRAKKFLLAQN